MRKYRAKNLERERERERKWREANPEILRASKRKSDAKAREANPEKVREEHRIRQARYAARNPEKMRAYKRVYYALKTGKLQREPCEVCGAEKVHAHHDDYSKPLEVRWLCTACHELHHHPI
jgi:ribosomal protein S27AE